MRKFIVHIIFFFLLVSIVDIVAGQVFWYLQSKVANGRTGAEYHLCKESYEDILVMGSSRASHHYVPSVFSDSLGMSCFIAGQDGNGIILQYGRWKMISERYSPKLIIYDVSVDFDLRENDNFRYIDRLKPYSRDVAVWDYLRKLFPLEGVKLFSQLYRYNYKFLEIVSDCRLKNKSDQNGYIPLFGSIRDEIVRRDVPAEAASFPIDSVKLSFLVKLVEEVRDQGGKMVFVVSPYWKSIRYDYSSLQALAMGLDVPLFDYSYTSGFSDNRDLFEDSSHLNDLGATLFSQDLVKKIKAFLECGL
ncbi:MAG: hypothetical protein IKX28_07105 [Bacteroidales bacterium]|nr:hypothetical protein [Bacteroidales bacterium]